MAEHTPGYVVGLTQELSRRPDLLRAAEDELAKARLFRATAASFINNPIHDHTARCALAELLGLPAPRPDKEPTHG